MLKFVEICHLLNRQKNFNREQKERTAIVKLTFAQRLGFGRQKPASFLPDDEIRSLRFQAELCTKIFEIWKGGVEIMDEVDLLLHPLKSELNWPLGDKIPLDFTRSNASGGSKSGGSSKKVITASGVVNSSTLSGGGGHTEICHGYRWMLPGFILDIVLTCSGLKSSQSSDVGDSREARTHNSILTRSNSISRILLKR